MLGEHVVGEVLSTELEVEVGDIGAMLGIGENGLDFVDRLVGEPVVLDLDGLEALDPMSGQ